MAQMFKISEDVQVSEEPELQPDFSFRVTLITCGTAEHFSHRGKYARKQALRLIKWLKFVYQPERETVGEEDAR